MAEDARAPDAVFSRVVSLGDFAEGLSGRIEATPEERAALAERFGVESLESFGFDYALQPVGKDRAHLTGQIHSTLTQLCIVTLEPVQETVEEAVSVDCIPQERIRPEAAVALEADPLALPDDPPVPIVGGRIDVGALAREVLASAINPYPRREGAEFGWDDPKDEDGDASGPFAELAKLRSKR
jgi:Large ribosomal RNA subunit accumulation protein YceD